MLKTYKIGSLFFQFEEGQQPEGAIEVKERKAANKAATPKTRARKTVKKSGE
jgi:hypothetical protein